MLFIFICLYIIFKQFLIEYSISNFAFLLISLSTQMKMLKRQKDSIKANCIENGLYRVGLTFIVYVSINFPGPFACPKPDNK